MLTYTRRVRDCLIPDCVTKSKNDMKEHPELLEGRYAIYSPFSKDTEAFVEDLKDEAFNLLRDSRERGENRVKATYLASKLLLAAAVLDDVLINSSDTEARKSLKATQ